jgi:hypothetical protein
MPSGAQALLPVYEWRCIADIRRSMRYIQNIRLAVTDLPASHLVGSDEDLSESVDLTISLQVRGVSTIFVAARDEQTWAGVVHIRAETKPLACNSICGTDSSRSRAKTSTPTP